MSAANLCPGGAIASCALRHYKSLPNHGKPQGQEWTVYAALVVTTCKNKNSGAPYVLCSATGSKCTTTGPEGFCVRDLHAEVLVKRGFQRLLWKEIRSGNLKVLRIEAEVDKDTSSEAMYSLNPDFQLHLYISDSPCGDATIYKLGNGDMNFTGAKLIVAAGVDGDSLSCHDHATTVTREATQHLGRLRIKSGRSNLPNHLRSTSLSCSDKLLKWAVLGLQGSSLRHHIIDPIRLTSVVVSRDPHAESIQLQHQALERAIFDRRDQVITELQGNEGFCESHSIFLVDLKNHAMVVSVVDQVFQSAKSQLVVPFQNGTSTTSEVINENGKRTMTTVSNNDKSKSKKKTSPCGFCLNWQLDDERAEILVGARGTKHGKKARTDADYIKQASRLCRRNLHNLRLDHQDIETKTGIADYASIPMVPLGVMDTKKAIFATKPLQGWIKSTR